MYILFNVNVRYQIGNFHLLFVALLGDLPNPYLLPNVASLPTRAHLANDNKLYKQQSVKYTV